MHNLNNKLKPISNSNNLSGEKVAFTAVERIKTAITTAIDNSTSTEEIEQIKVAAKLAIKVVQENINNGYRLNMLNQTIMQELEQLGEPANNLFKTLTQNNLSDLEKTSIYYNQSFRSHINFGFHKETNYTSVNNSLIEFIDQIQRRVDFFTLLSDEVSLDILSWVTKTKDQKSLSLVCKNINRLVTDRGNLANPFLSIRVNYDAWVEENELAGFLKLLITLNRTTSLNLSKDKSTGNFSRYLYSLVPFSSALPSAFKRFPYIKLFKALINLDTLISLNITGCDLNDEELELIGRIPRLKEVIMTEGMNNNTKIKILSANDSEDNPKLYVALEKGNIGLVVALTKAILSSKLPQEEKSKLLAAINSVETPGLGIAMFYGHAEAITRFATLILSSNLSDKEKFELLAAKKSNRTPGLWLALQNGHTKAVAVFTTAILNSELPNPEKIELLTAKSAGGIPGLMQALCAAKRADRASGLMRALYLDNAEAVAVFAKVVLSSDIPNQAKFELLAAKRADGTPGLYFALQNGHAEEVTTFITAVINSNFSYEEKTKLCAAKSADGVPGLLIALENGHAKAVAIFITAILNSELPNPKKIELLAAKTVDGIPGLQMALQNGHAKAVAVFARVVSSLDIPNHEKLELLAAKRADGVPGLFLALYRDNAEAVAVFAKVVSSLDIPDHEKLELLAAKRADGVPGLYAALGHGGRKAALTLIMQLVQLEINLLTLNEWMTLDIPEVGCKLHGLLIAIARDNKFLRDLNEILLGSQPNELYKEIIKTHEPIITQRYTLGEESLKALGYSSSEKFWNKMSEVLKLLKRLHNGYGPEPITFLARAQSLYKSFI